jgi:hypothetical protein
VLVACALLGIGTYFARDQHIVNTYVDELPRGPVRADVRTLEQKVAGVIRVVVHLEGATDAMKRPEMAIFRIDFEKQLTAALLDLWESAERRGAQRKS